VRLLLIFGLWTAAIWLVAVKTQRGAAWDQREELRRVTRGRDALHEALHACTEGQVRDSSGFYHR
jgi:hypothetical protein